MQVEQQTQLSGSSYLPYWTGFIPWLAYGIKLREIEDPKGEIEMLSSFDSPNFPIEKIERLSKVVIESLQELSSSNQRLSTASLFRALAPKKDILDLLVESSPQVPQPVDAGHLGEQIKAMKSQIQKLQDRENRLVGHLDDLEQRIENLLAFQKKSTPVLVLLAQKTRDKRLKASLERFKSLVRDDAGLSILEQCMQDIKNIVLKEESTNEPESGALLSSPSPRQSLAADILEDVPMHAERSVFLLQLQEAFLTILSQFKPISGEVYSQRFNELEQRIKSCKEMGGLLALGHEITEIIHDYVGYTSEERNQVANFVTELGKDLLEMENQLSGSLTEVQKSFQVNNDFNNAVQGQVEDIKESFNFNKTLEEIRGFVLSKLKAIKTALENKRKQDDSQLKHANQKLGDLQGRLRNMKTEIEQVQKRTKILEAEVQLDALTGIHNRRAYELRMQEELQRYHRYNQVFSLVMFDVDHFKQVNDQHGHKTGDKCLVEIINRIKPSLRKADFLARYGGEEFVIILTGTPKENACKFAEKIRHIVDKTCFVSKHQEIPVTISLGVTEVEPADHTPEDVFARVDAAMYKSKNEGRNRVSQI